MQKIKIVLTILAITLLLSACNRGDDAVLFDDGSLNADNRLEEILTAIDENDSDELENMFSKTTLSQVDNFGFIENLVVFYLENSGHKITLYTKRWFALANHFFLCYNIFRYFSIFGGFLLTLNQYLL